MILERHTINSAHWMMIVGFVVTMFIAGCGGGGGGEGAGTGGVSGSDWTVMVYLDGDNNLEGNALIDFNEMEAAIANPNTKIIVLFDRCNGENEDQGDWKGTRLYEINHDTDLNRIASKRLSDTTWLGLYGDEADELNMGSGKTLRDFVSFCSANYPSDHTALILWNHGDGWIPASADIPSIESKGIASDRASNEDSLSIKEVASALDGQEVDLLGFDACYMSELEVAWELRNSARYMVASEDIEPGDGWEYTELFNRFSGMSGNEKTPEALARCIFESYINSFTGGSEYTLAVLDLAKMAPLGAAVDALAAEIKGLGPDVVTTARYGVVNYNYDKCVDLRQFAEVLGASAEVRAAIDAALSQAVILNGARHLEKACGLSIYFPKFGSTSFDYANYTFANLAFVQETLWRDALDSYSENAFYYTFETVAGTPGLNTQLDVYTDSLTFIAGNDDLATPYGFSGLRIPVAKGASYRLRVSSPGSFWHAATQGSYGVYAGTGRATPCAPIAEAGDTHEPDDGPANASILDPEIVQPHFLSSGDEDWVRITVPE